MASPAGAAPCQICANAADNRVHVAREMMFGLRDLFHYLECGACGCLQLLDVPGDLSKYYPPTYYSFAGEGRLKRLLNASRAARALGRSTTMGWLAEQVLGPYYAVESLRAASVDADARILDVGCGAGHLIRDLKDLGYAHVAGIDPYVAADIQHDNGVVVSKAPISDARGRFDVVMLHHSFEHMASPAQTLRDLRELLSPRGRLLIRVPVAGSFAWRHYGVDWVNLDAPRHVFLHTSKSMRLLATQAQLEVTRVRFEGNPSQFIASEQYQQDIPLSDPRSVYSGSWRRWIGWWQSRRLAPRAAALNASGEGDWACFELTAAARK